MKGLITDFTDMEKSVFDGMFEHAEASTRQLHRRQERQTVQERRVERKKKKLEENRKKKEERVGRDGRKDRN